MRKNDLFLEAIKLHEGTKVDFIFCCLCSLNFMNKIQLYNYTITTKRKFKQHDCFYGTQLQNL